MGFKRVLSDARSYGGATLSSDHKIVIAKVDLDCPFKMHRSKSKHTSYDISNLTCNRQVQLKYKSLLKSNISNRQHRNPSNPASKLRTLMNTVKSTAVEAIGLRKPNQKPNFSNDKTVVALSLKRKQLRLQLNNNMSADRSVIRASINRIQKQIQKRLKLKK